MKRNFTAVLPDLDGQPMKVGAPKLKVFANGQPVYDEKTSEVIVLQPAPNMTLRRVALDSIRMAIDGDKDMSGEEMVRLYGLAQRIAKEPVVELTAEEVTKLKARIKTAWQNVVVYGAACAMLDADYVEPAAPAAASSMLQECRDSGQMDASQVAEHQRAGEL